MKCPRCDHENPPAAKFCLECGARLQVVCPRCGVELPPTAKFCPECGASLTAPARAVPDESPTLEGQSTALQPGLPPSFREQIQPGEGPGARDSRESSRPDAAGTPGENRLVTVLFADMSGSVERTAGLHPEDAAALVNRLLQAMLEVLQRYEGRVDRFLGDGLLAVFGVPQARESDPERAILAALEIRQAALQLELHVAAGLNTGEVYAGAMGSERHEETTVMGPVVNLASRLQGQAEPGQILVGEATYRLTRRAFDFVPVTLAVRGIPQPVVAYAVERVLPRLDKVRGIEGLHSELIGREEELSKLHGAMTALLRSQGQIVSLIGEAGVGKSRLASELKKALGSWLLALGEDGRTSLGSVAAPSLGQEPRPECQEPPLWLEGRCLDLGVSASYAVFMDLFRDFFAWGPDEDELARGERLAATLRGLVARGDLSQERCETLGPLLGRLLSVRFRSDWDQRLQHATPQEIREQTFLAIRDFFAALARRRPVVLVFEGLHWADLLSLEAITLLMETLGEEGRHGGLPLLLLCVYRPEREHRCWHLGTLAARKCPERYTELHLRELTPAQSRRQVESLLRIEDLPASVRELIGEKARGNPFFVEEVIRSLIASGQLYQEGDRWRAREELRSVMVPESIQSVILSRVDRLEPQLKQVLQSAAVIGRVFPRSLLEEVSSQRTELDRTLWALEDQALIYQERVIPEPEYSFKHVLLQETVYQNILRRRRATIHQRVAEAIERLYGERLEPYHAQLAHHYEQGGRDEKAVEYTLRAAERALQWHAGEEAIQHLTAALKLLDGLPQDEPHLRTRWRAVESLDRAYWIREERERGQGPLRDYLALAEGVGYWWGVAAAHCALGVSTFMTEHLEKAVEVCERHQVTDWLTTARQWLVFRLIRGMNVTGAEPELPRAEALARRMLQAPQALTREDAQAAYSQLMHACARQGKWQELAAAFRQSIAVGGPGEGQGSAPPWRTGLWSWLPVMEHAYDQMGKRAEFIAFCEEAKRLLAQADIKSSIQWYLGPAVPSEQFSQVLFHDDFDQPELREAWQWHDPLSASQNSGGPAYSLTDRPGYLVLCGDGDLWPWNNLTAPRLLQEARGDFALETRMEGNWEEREYGGSGLLIWKDVLNFLRFEKMAMGPGHSGSIELSARVRGEFLFLGRGRLHSDRYTLRLERTGEQIVALCSADGVNWLTCGRVDFIAQDPLLVGVHALGGMVTRYDYVRVLGKGSP